MLLKKKKKNRIPLSSHRTKYTQSKKKRKKKCTKKGPVLGIHHRSPVGDPSVPFVLKRSAVLPQAAVGPKVLATRPCREHKGGEKQSHLSYKDYESEVNSHVLAELYICLLAFRYLEFLINPTISYIQLFIKAWRSGEWENEEYSPSILIV